MEENEANSKKSNFKAFLPLIICFILVVLVRMFVLEPYIIPSASMETTIMTGDNIMANKLAYLASEPDVGDIITFYEESTDKVLIKRVIAKGGQVIDIKDGNLYIDGVEQDESYTHGKPTFELDSNIQYPYTVPKDHLWMMGDNRTNSQDSRYFGAIPIDSVVAEAMFSYFPSIKFF